MDVNRFWKPGSTGVGATPAPAPEDAVIAGDRVYVGRVPLSDGIVIPCKVVQSVAYLTVAGQVQSRQYFEYLCWKNYEWTKMKDNVIPSGAIVGGCTRSGETLYIGRATWRGILVPGAVMSREKRLFLAVGDAVISMTDFEVLVGQ